MEREHEFILCPDGSFYMPLKDMDEEELQDLQNLDVSHHYHYSHIMEGFTPKCKFVTQFEGLEPTILSLTCGDTKQIRKFILIEFVDPDGNSPTHFVEANEEGLPKL